MKSGLSYVFVLGLLCSGTFVISSAGCSEDPAPVTPTDPPCDFKDPQNPPIACGPEAAGATKCSSTTKVEKCPANECSYQVKQSGDIVNLRMGRIRLWTPDALLSLARIAVDPNVNPKCAIERHRVVHLAHPDRHDGEDHEDRRFARRPKSGCPRAIGQEVRVRQRVGRRVQDRSDLPGVRRSQADPVDLRPITTTYTEKDGAFTTPKMARVNVPIFDTSGIPIILPLQETELKNVKINGNCIGGYDKKYWCDGDSLGWTTGGAIVGKMTAEEADRVPVKSAGCQSLCAILVNDSTKTDGKVCKRGADGKVPEIGNTCVGGTSCKNAFTLSATFAPTASTIVGRHAPTDGGTDTGGGDTGSGDTGAATGSASDSGDRRAASTAAEFTRRFHGDVRDPYSGGRSRSLFVRRNGFAASP